MVIGRNLLVFGNALYGCDALKFLDGGDHLGFKLAELLLKPERNLFCELGSTDGLDDERADDEAHVDALIVVLEENLRTVGVETQRLLQISS